MPLLKVIVKSVESLNSISTHGASHYISIHFSGQILNTNTVKSSRNPIWNEEILFFFESNEMTTGPILFLLKKTSWLPIPRKKRVICWCELTKDTVQHLSEEFKSFHLQLIDNSTGILSGFLNVACQVVDHKGPEQSLNDEIKQNAGYFLIDVYHAEHLPHSDFGALSDCCARFRQKKKIADRIDPYLVITFSGNEVRTKVIEHSVNPKWMQRLSLPFKLPLQDESLRLELKDKDLMGSDDLIATAVLSINEMIPNEESELPSFGPSYINLYGSPRKFSLMKHKENISMNSGQVEGCAFKGRVFLHVTMVLGEIPSSGFGFEDIPLEVVEKSKGFLIEENCVIRVAFIDCYWMQNSNPKSIEVSIGPFGDSTVLDKDSIRASAVEPFSAHEIQMAVTTKSPGFTAPWRVTEKPCVIFQIPLLTAAIGEIQVVNAILNLRDKSLELLQILNKNLKAEFGRNLYNFVAVCKSLIATSMESSFGDGGHTASSKIFIECLESFAKEASHILSGHDLKHGNLVLWEDHKMTVESWLDVIDRLVVTFRSTVPDIFIWLSDYFVNKRLSYVRLSAAEIWYDDVVELKGRICDVTTSFALKYPWGVVTSQNPGEIRVRMWLGCEKSLKECLMRKYDVEEYNFYSEKSDPIAKHSSIASELLSRGRSVDNSIRKLLSEDTVQKSLGTDNPEDKDEARSFVNFSKWLTDTTNDHQHNMKTFKLLKVLNVVKRQTFANLRELSYFAEKHSYHLNVYIYQARNLLVGDKTGLSDPFVKVTFGSRGAQTRCFPESVCPVWVECLVIHDVIIPGPELTSVKHNDVVAEVPMVIAEIYDYDTPEVTNFIGRTSFAPNPTATVENIISWRTLFLGDKWAGELLAGAELISSKYTLVEDDDDVKVYTIPKDIRPKLQRSNLEIFCSRLSGCKICNQPFIEIYCYDIEPIASTDVLLDFPKITNFRSNHFIKHMSLPIDDVYLPTVMLRLKVSGPLGHIMTLGVATLDLCNLVSADLDFEKRSKRQRSVKKNGNGRIMDVLVKRLFHKKKHFKNLENVIEKNTSDDESLDWWSRYYASKHEYSKCGEFIGKGYIPFKVFNVPLEETEPYKTCLRTLHNANFYHGKNQFSDDNQTKVATLLVGIGLHRYEETDIDDATENHENISATLFGNMSKQCLEVDSILVRVYFIRALNLTPKDLVGLTDPFVRVRIDESYTDIPGTFHRNTLDPFFGRVFETTLHWPGTPHLTIEVMDKDLISKDDLTGKTTIDLETRFLLSKMCHANCGVSPEFIVKGHYSWRDMETPKQILESVSQSRSFEKPIYFDADDIKVGSCDLNGSCSEQEDEKLALSVLHEMNLVVPEHVETRSLYHPSFPGVTQGQLEMWIDIFPIIENRHPPSAVDISLRPPKPYVLRCVVYNVHQVSLEERNIFGDMKSDVYVEGWLDGQQESKQMTDVHYRCFSGEANFNWRMVFNFEFLHGQNVIVRNARHHITDLHKSEILLAPILNIRLYDYDVFSHNDPLGTLVLPLLALKPPLRRLKNFKKYFIYRKREIEPDFKVNLFKQKHIYGFWPCFSPDGQKIVGKVELELELLTEDEAAARPAGLGRSEPNANPVLSKPLRPLDSINWLTSPLKGLHVFWKWLRCKCIILGIILLCVVLLYSTGKWLLVALIHKWVYNL